MLTNAEGPIVQSFYEMALLSWWSPLQPPLPLLNKAPSYPANPSQQHYNFGHAHPVLSTKGDLDSNASKSRKTLAEHHAQTELANDGQRMEKKNDFFDQDNEGEAERVDDDFTSSDKINQHLSGQLLLIAW